MARHRVVLLQLNARSVGVSEFQTYQSYAVGTPVFAAGIGENAPLIRQRICEELGFLGIELDDRSNAKNAPLISPDAGRVKVRVIPTDEELMIARSVSRLLDPGGIREN